MDKQEYAKCIEDDIDFLKRNLPKPLFECLWTGHIIDVLKASINMFYDQPSLPSNLDEAAEEHAKRCYTRNAPGERLAACKYDFKAGAEWMAKQGLTVDGTFHHSSGYPSVIELKTFLKDYEGADVIVNIQKKQ